MIIIALILSIYLTNNNDVQQQYYVKYQESNRVISLVEDTHVYLPNTRKSGYREYKIKHKIKDGKYVIGRKRNKTFGLLVITDYYIKAVLPNGDLLYCSIICSDRVDLPVFQENNNNDNNQNDIDEVAIF